MDKGFLLVITMWGNNGIDWEYIGNQIVLQQVMTKEHCVYLIDKDMWEATYENRYYRMMAHCFPEECAGKESCD